VKILVVAAHPDDEVLGCGGTVALHAARGDEVHTLILGEGSTSRAAQRDPAGDDPEVSHLQECARAAALALGVASVRFGGLPDNRMDRLDLLDVVKLVESTIDELQPAVLYTHHHGDLNVDHQIAHRAALTAARPLPGCPVASIYTFETASSTEWGRSADPFTPQRFVDVTETFDRKLAALACYESEMRPFPHARSLDAITALATWRGASVSVARAEAFMVVREVR
jgi:LmbE family N-acetylglucosaminyl deacetylase